MFFVNIVKKDVAAITYQEERAVVVALTSARRRRNIDPVDYPENLDSLVTLQDGVLIVNKKTAKKFGIAIKAT